MDEKTTRGKRALTSDDRNGSWSSRCAKAQRNRDTKEKGFVLAGWIGRKDSHKSILWLTRNHPTSGPWILISTFSPYIVLLSRAASFHQDSPFSSFPPSHPGPPCFLLLLMRPPVLWPGKQRTLFTIDFILTWSSYARHDPLCQIIVWDHPWSLNLILSFVHRVVARNTYFSAVHPLQPKLQDLGSIRCSFWL